MNLKYFIFQKIPPRLFVLLRGQGWWGNFKSWEEASRLSTGYDAKNILENSKNILLKLKNASNKQNIHYSWELLSSLMWIAAQNRGCLNVLDFGGALGTIYYQNKFFFDQLETLNWNVIEQPHFIELGKKEFETSILKFHFSIDDCVFQNIIPINCLLFSSVLQYLEKPYELLADVLKRKFKYIIIARTYFTKKKSDRISIQKVPKNYYDASYPSWIFEKQKFINFFDQHGYEVIFEYQEKYQLNIPSENIGCLFKLKENGNHIIAG